MLISTLLFENHCMNYSNLAHWCHNESNECSQNNTDVDQRLHKWISAISPTSIFNTFSNVSHLWVILVDKVDRQSQDGWYDDSPLWIGSNVPGSNTEVDMGFVYIQWLTVQAIQVVFVGDTFQFVLWWHSDCSLAAAAAVVYQSADVCPPFF